MDIASLCPLCHGTRWVITTSDDPYDDDRPEVERCPACQKAPAPTGGKEGGNPDEGEV